ncbi:hypothetical protein D9M73_191650 [compost metagenome]
MTGQHVHVIDFPAIYQQAGGVLGLQAFVRRVEYRGLHRHFTERQGGARGAQLEGAAATGIIVFAASLLIDRQQPRPGMPLATVELQSEKPMGIDAKTNGSRGKSGLERRNEPLVPFLGVVFA